MRCLSVNDVNHNHMEARKERMNMNIWISATTQYITIIATTDEHSKQKWLNSNYYLTFYFYLSLCLPVPFHLTNFRNMRSAWKWFVDNTTIQDDVEPEHRLWSATCSVQRAHTLTHGDDFPGLTVVWPFSTSAHPVFTIFSILSFRRFFNSSFRRTDFYLHTVSRIQTQWNFSLCSCRRACRFLRVLCSSKQFSFSCYFPTLFVCSLLDICNFAILQCAECTMHCRRGNNDCRKLKANSNKRNKRKNLQSMETKWKSEKGTGLKQKSIEIDVLVRWRCHIKSSNRTHRHTHKRRPENKRFDDEFSFRFHAAKDLILFCWRSLLLLLLLLVVSVFAVLSFIDMLQCSVGVSCQKHLTERENTKYFPSSHVSISDFAEEYCFLSHFVKFSGSFLGLEMLCVVLVCTMYVCLHHFANF